MNRYIYSSFVDRDSENKAGSEQLHIAYEHEVDATMAIRSYSVPTANFQCPTNNIQDESIPQNFRRGGGSRPLAQASGSARNDNLYSWLLAFSHIVHGNSSYEIPGFPYPENIALSSRLESVVRARGGVPATIGVLNGVAKVGFRAGELVEFLETASKQKTMKLSRRDLGYICGLVSITKSSE